MQIIFSNLSFVRCRAAFCFFKRKCTMMAPLLFCLMLSSCEKQFALKGEASPSAKAASISEADEARGTGGHTASELQTFRGRKIIKKGDISVSCGNMARETEKIFLLIKKYGAYIAEEAENSGEYQTSKFLKIKIPSENFDDFITELTKEVKRITDKDISLEDVTEECIDIDARLKVKKEAEKRYVSLLQSAKTVSEILEIQHKIQELQSDIESIEGRRTFLQNQVQFSTLNLSLYEGSQNRGGKLSPLFFGFGTAFFDGIAYFLSFIGFIIRFWIFIVIIGIGVFLWRIKK